MSGVDAQYLAGKTFGLYLVALGLLQWLDPVLEKPSSPGWDRRVSDWQLRYGYGGTDLRRIRRASNQGSVRTPRSVTPRKKPPITIIMIGSIRPAKPGMSR